MTTTAPSGSGGGAKRRRRSTQHSPKGAQIRKQALRQADIVRKVGRRGDTVTRGSLRAIVPNPRRSHSPTPAPTPAACWRRAGGRRGHKMRGTMIACVCVCVSVCCLLVSPFIDHTLHEATLRDSRRVLWSTNTI